MDPKKIVILFAPSQNANHVERAFLRAHFDVISTHDPQEAIVLLKREQPHALVIDWDLVNGTLKSITHVIQENCKKTALVLLTKNHNLEDRIHALDIGADECMDQPPRINELIAKVKALIRRIELVDHSPKTLNIRNLEINLDTHEVRRDGKNIDLTYTQFKLLYLLASKRDYVYTRDEILAKVWGENAFVTNRTVDVHVKRLREKLGEHDQPAHYIQTIHGLGYRFG